MSEEVEYKVEILKSIRRVRANKKRERCGIEVFIKWEGYPDSENTWEPIENLNPDTAVFMLRELGDGLKTDGLRNAKERKLIEDAVKKWRYWAEIAQSSSGELQEDESGRSQSSKVSKISKASLAKKAESQEPASVKRVKSRTSQQKTSSPRPTPQPPTPPQPPNPAHEEFKISKKRILVEYSRIYYDETLKKTIVYRNEIDPHSLILTDTKPVDLVTEIGEAGAKKEVLFSLLVDELIKKEKELIQLNQLIEKLDVGDDDT